MKTVSIAPEKIDIQVAQPIDLEVLEATTNILQEAEEVVVINIHPDTHLGIHQVEEVMTDTHLKLHTIDIQIMKIDTVIIGILIEVDKDIQ